MVIPGAILLALEGILILGLNATMYLLILYVVTQSSIWILKTLHMLDARATGVELHGQLKFKEELLAVAANGRIAAFLTLVAAHLAGMYALAYILGSAVRPL